MGAYRHVNVRLLEQTQLDAATVEPSFSQQHFKRVATNNLPTVRQYGYLTARSSSFHCLRFRADMSVSPRLGTLKQAMATVAAVAESCRSPRCRWARYAKTTE